MTDLPDGPAGPPSGNVGSPLWASLASESRAVTVHNQVLLYATADEAQLAAGRIDAQLISDCISASLDPEARTTSRYRRHRHMTLATKSVGYTVGLSDYTYLLGMDNWHAYNFSMVVIRRAVVVHLFGYSSQDGSDGTDVGPDEERVVALWSRDSKRCSSPRAEPPPPARTRRSRRRYSPPVTVVPCT